jgi:hypothetical protein
MKMSMEGKTEVLEEISVQGFLNHHKSHMDSMEFNPGRRDEMPATNSLSHGRA